MGLSCGENDLDDNESEVVLVDESRESRQKVGDRMDVHHQTAQFDAQFWPIEHPMEPQDEDRPVKCPIPNSSVINDEGEHGDRYAESMRKRAELPTMVNKEGIVVVAAEPPIRAVRKRHHTLTHGDRMVTPSTRMNSLPSISSQNLKIFRMLKQFDKFEY